MWGPNIQQRWCPGGRGSGPSQHMPTSLEPPKPKDSRNHRHGEFTSFKAQLGRRAFCSQPHSMGRSQVPETEAGRAQGKGELVFREGLVQCWAHKCVCLNN